MQSWESSLIRACKPECPLKGALWCVLPPLAPLCLPGGYSTRGCRSAKHLKPTCALLPEARVCSRAAPARALQPAGTKHLAGVLLALHLKLIPSIEAWAETSCGLWPRYALGAGTAQAQRCLCPEHRHGEHHAWPALLPSLTTSSPPARVQTTWQCPARLFPSCKVYF